MLFEATVIEAGRYNTKWKTVAERAGASRELIAAHTYIATMTTLKVTACSRRAA